MFQKLVLNQKFGLEFFAVQLDTFRHHQDYEQVNLYKKMASLFHWLDRPRREITTSLQLAQNWKVPTKNSQKLNF